jgi:hypothetical protein
MKDYLDRKNTAFLSKSDCFVAVLQNNEIMMFKVKKFEGLFNQHDFKAFDGNIVDETL